jgi:hypothetical protein
MDYSVRGFCGVAFTFGTGIVGLLNDMIMKMKYAWLMVFFLFTPVKDLAQNAVAGKAVAVVRYLYFPNMEAYFDLDLKVYLYKADGVWVSTPTMAPNYRGYCVRNGYNVPLEGYTGETPYLELVAHKLRYPADFSSKRRPKVVVATD